MPIIKDFTAPNGASTTLHLVKRIEIVFPADAAQVSVLSYPNEASYVAGASPLWSTPLLVPLGGFSGAPLAAVEAWLTSAGESPFLNGTITLDPNESLESAKLRQWALIKGAREKAVFAGFEWNGHMFDCDLQSQSLVQGAAQLATLAMLASQPFSIPWTLQNNDSLTMSGADVIAAGTAMGQHIMANHAISRVLRNTINAATTKEAVEAVTWPA